MNHDCWEVNLLSSIHKVNKTLIHSILKIMALTSRDDILNNEPKEQLMKRSHLTFLDGLGGFLSCLLAQCFELIAACLLYTSPSPRDGLLSRMPSSA